MSALTFELLSISLTQALSEQGNTPPDTTARCNLGRDKVMVLVEYPLDSAQAEPLASKTLDWLEEHLRYQFDTTGLPEEAADLAESGEEVSVHLFLKHLSEAKPFTMRSFVWKVDDGFDDIFGQALSQSHVGAVAARTFDHLGEEAEGTVFSAPSNLAITLPIERGPVERGPVEGGLVEGGLVEGVGLAAEMELPLSVADIDEPVPSELDDEYLQLDDEPNLDLELGAQISADLGLEVQSDEGLELLSELNAELHSELTTELNSGFNLEPNPDLNLDLDLDLGLEPAPAIEAEDASEADLTVNLVLDTTNEDSSVDLSLPGEAPMPESAELDLPTVDLPVVAQTSRDLSTDFFALDEAAGEDVDAPHPVNAEGPDLFDLTLLDQDEHPSYPLTNSVGDTVMPGSVLSPTGENSTGKTEALLDLDQDELAALSGQDDVVENQSATDYFLTDNLLLESVSATQVQANQSAADELTHDGPETDDSEGYKPADDNPYDPETYDPDTYEYESEEYDSEEYENDPVYYLKGEDEGEYDEQLETVALIDDQEVQRQREQWQQQARGNRWIFVGALGFVVVGALGFVFTRPCMFGTCDRLQVAQAQGDQALDKLQSETSLAAVKDSKAQLTRSIHLLKPIPLWSPYYHEAQDLLPEYENQVSALEQVTKAQDQAYRAAVNSQNPPHPVATWQDIANDWLSATRLLEAVSADSAVRELAERKLLEYRANRATILVRIDAESKSEISLRQSQQAATRATNLTENASTLQDWEDILVAWQSAVNHLRQIPQGTQAHGEAQQLLPEYEEKLEEARDRTIQERGASQDLQNAKQLAADAQRAENDNQWTLSAQSWKTALSELQDIPPGTLPHHEAEILTGLYASLLNKAENNLQVALRFQPVEPDFFAACGPTLAQKCTYAVRDGKVRLELVQGYDNVIDQSITPPHQRRGAAPDAQLVSQSNQLLQAITLLSTQAQVPVELYDAQGGFLARYRPDLNGFVREPQEG